MKTLSPAVITLPWRQDAAEFYFSRLSHLPWAMLLHSGYADHPYSRFDIVVAEPICTLTTFGKETVVSESEKRTTTTDDPLQARYRSAGYGSGYLRLGAGCRPPASNSFFAES